MNYQRRMNELKAIARDLGVEPTGDRRKRETWEQAIEQHQLFRVPQSSDTSDASPVVEFEPVILSDRFVATYTPPQVQIHYQVESVAEFPDPDDFERLDVFSEAIALWDSEHFDVPLDSFSYWAPCPDDWYEPAGENSPGVDRIQALEQKNISGFDRFQALLKSSSTSDFFIPVFERDRPDEPPTAGVGARLPKPKPPSFPPFHIKRIPNAYQTHSCFVGATAGYSGRSPPGGDGMA